MTLPRPHFPQHADAPWLLDLCCGAGGTAVGYWRAGFNVVGVDIAPQRRYPFAFVQADALAFLRRLIARGLWRTFVAIHASPPCQAYSKTQRIRSNEHPDLIAELRALIGALGLPYVIENVEDARDELRSPITLCGAMFPGLRVYRHRLFESNAPLIQPPHPKHRRRQTKMGRAPQADEFMHVVGNFSGAIEARAAMGIDWMTRNELREAVPPAYTEYIGYQLKGVV